MNKPDYGIDAPGVIRNFFFGAAALLAVSFYIPAGWACSARWTGSIFLLEGLAMLAYAKFGKFRHRARMLAMVAWRGNENVLDVGTGRGLLMIGAAQKLKSGKAVGIDIWSAKDLSGNAAEPTLNNIALEQVEGRAEIKTEDMRQMSFPDATFDVVLSNLAIHNIPDAGGRAKACAEIARVLKPGGTALISDFMKTAEYMSAFRTAGLTVSRTPPYFFDTFPPLRIVAARKD
jgi:SAM-dependent methyltransferase